MKKLLTILLVTVMAVMSLPTTSSALVKEFKLGYITNPIGPLHEGALKFGELLKQKTNGQYTVKVFPSGQLGNERELTEAVILGTIDMTLSGPTPVSWYTPEYSMVNCPFIYKDLQHYMRVWDGEVGKFINDKLLEKINEVSNKVAEAGMKQHANFMIVAPAIADMLNSLREDIDEV